MAFIKFLCCFLVISLAEGMIKHRHHGIPPLNTDLFATNSTAVWGNLTQYLDHFNPTDMRTWTMRYLSNDVCFKSGGPIVIFIGGEGPIDDSYLTGGAVYDIACENNGYLFNTEHRYYGESYPTEDFSTENLRYLTTDQALGDIAYFVQYLKESNPDLETAKVIVIGGSYAGSLATWSRIKYPHLIDIAYSSSGPVRDVIDYFDYFEVVASNIKLVSEPCYDTIQSGFSQMQQMLETDEGALNVSKMFSSCELLNNTDPQRSYFFNSVAFIFGERVQYSQEGDIELMCQQLANYTGSDVEKIGNMASVYYDPYCVTTYDIYVNSLLSPNLTTSNRLWNYQICSEIGYFQTSNSENLIFGQTFPVDLYFQMCKDIFGESFDQEHLAKSVARNNLFYGSDFPVVTKLITVQGSVDPWHPAGILENLNSQTVTILINGTSHCADINAFYSTADEEMKEVMQTVRDTIKQWLNEE